MRSTCLSFVLLLSGVLVACGEKPEDKILAMYQRGEEAIAGNDVVTLADTMTPESGKRLLEAQRLALTCKAEDTKKLSPALLGMVLAMRNRLDAKALEGMSIQDLLRWQIQDDMMIVDKEYGIVPCRVTVSGNSARMQMGEEVEEASTYRPRLGRRSALGSATGLISSALKKPKVVPIPGLVYYYVNRNGFWFYDQVAREADYDKELIALANQEGMPVFEFLAAWENEANEGIKADIWEPLIKPPPKKKTTTKKK